MSEVCVAGLCRTLTRAGVAPPDTLSSSQPCKSQSDKNQADLVCAVSGGLDSMVLLHLLVEAGYAVRAVHVDHAAHPESAYWADWVRKRVRAIGVTLTVHRLDAQPGNNSEERWRNARRSVFELETGRGILLTAHHQDDQAETLLLQLLRGAGAVGLQAMPLTQVLPSGAQHIRPLLEHTRAELLAYATRQKIEWIEDPSNQNEHFDRNFLRGSVLPLILERWPGAIKAIARSSQLISESAALNTVLAAQDAGISDDGTSLDWTSLESVGLARQANAVRFWLSRLGCRYPSRRRLAEALRQWNEAMDDRGPVLELPEGTAQRYRNRLVFVGGADPAPTDWSATLAAGEWLTLPGDTGQLGLFERPPGYAASRYEPPRQESGRPAPDLVEQKQPGRAGLAVLAELATGPLTLRFRQNGERLRRASGQHQSLKHWFQDNDIPPVMRSRLPLVFLNDELVAIADRWVDARYRPDAASEKETSHKVCYLVWSRSNP